MSDELSELLETAIYKEIEAQALYSAGQKKTQDPGAVSLMKELAKEELRHAEELKRLKDKGLKKNAWHQKRVPDLKIAEYLTAADSVEGAGLQELLVFAMKREQQSVEFYSRMMTAMRNEEAKRLCEGLAQWELRHKLRLELLYEGLFYKED